MDIEAVAKQIEKLTNGLAVLQRMITQDLPVFPAERSALVEAGVCLNCGKPIGESRPVRGCHEYCYRQVRASIKTGEMTDFEAVESGIVLPKDPGGSRKPNDTELAKALAKKTNAVVADIHAQAEKLVAERDAKRKKKP